MKTFLLILLSLSAYSSPVPEGSPVSKVILSAGDVFRPIMDMHRKILELKDPSVEFVVLYNKRMIHPSMYDESKARFIETDWLINWGRDFLPELILDAQGNKKLVRFNYDTRDFAGDLSLAAAQKISDELLIPMESSPLNLQGGNILATDRGEVYLTKQVFKQNPTMSEEEITSHLLSVLAAKKIIWLEPLPNEPTGHVDIFTKYIGKNTMLVADSNLPAQKKHLALVASIFEKSGYKVVRISNAANEREFPVYTYLNSLIVNKTVFIPKYFSVSAQKEEKQALKAGDKAAIDTYKSLGYKVIAIPMYEVIKAMGAIHCLTKQY